jgi:hypothetical protein
VVLPAYGGVLDVANNMFVQLPPNSTPPILPLMVPAIINATPVVHEFDVTLQVGGIISVNSIFPGAPLSVYTAQLTATPARQ